MIKGLNFVPHGDRAPSPRREMRLFELGLFVQEFQDRIKKLNAVLLKQNEVRRIRNEHALLDRGVDKIAHQAFAILEIRPCVVLACDHERRRIDIGGVPQRSAGRLIKRILENPVWRAQARRRARVAGRIGRETRFPEFSRQSGIAVLVVMSSGISPFQRAVLAVFGTNR
jgi:hypothetical protein